jgi:hypothetical protein
VVRQKSNQVKSQRFFYIRRSNFKAILLLVIAGPLTFASCRAIAANLPSGFTEMQFGSNLSGSPTAMAFAPDGRLFVCQQGGQPRVIKMKAPRSPPTSQKTNPSRVFDPARVFDIRKVV